ncbi:hypothetical protein ACFPES_29440 [Paenibacillus sp. GCM10023248]|uniref:LiaF transmembrane domain-containing protein n=1 Tax=Bacillales TaxID=1385 RepID=UPI0023790522|nr:MULTISPECIES: hypothetical protein [Bacillales]MDD9271164.1 hypothetical protein [Paenibacillus sp. MAHUQ-63]
MNRSKSWALILITVGLLICMHQLGMHVHLMGLIVPAAMVGLGYVGIRNDKKIGWVIFGIGALILMTKLSGLLAVALAVGLIYYGCRMWKKPGYSSNYHDYR